MIVLTVKVRKSKEKMKKQLLVGFLVACAAIIGTAQPSYALLELVRTDTSQQKQEDQSGSGSETGAVLNAVKLDETESKRAEIQQKIDAKRAAVTEKLSGRRAELCEQREAKINEALTNRTAAAERYLEKFKTIHDRLSSFAADQQLTVENAAALGLILTDKQAHVEATIGVAKATTFDCSAASADNPGQVVKDLIAEEKQVLDEYRTALKDYADAVKAAALAGASNVDAVKPDEDTESQETAQ